jgi:cation diffusion facilitator CzcD-associated flavoprotein CzcO
VVLATGNTQRPRLPSWPDRELYSGELLHSSRYSNGSRFEGRTVLVVGFGNSGGEIAIDLCEHGARPTLAVRSAVNVIPRDMFGVPVLAVGIAMSPLPPGMADFLARPLLALTVGDITELGLRRLPYGPKRQIAEHGRIPLIDVGTLDLIRNGRITVAPGIRRFTPRGVVFEDDREAEFDAVVLATGYEPALRELLPNGSAALDEHGNPRSSGRELDRGLYFCGFYVAPTGMLREIGIEARRIAASIQRHTASA